MAMKAWQGIMIKANRTTAHNDLGNCLPEYHLGVKENLVIMDCTQICLTNGPNPTGNNVTAAPNIVVASKDNVANDISGLCILKYYLAQSGATNAVISQSIWTQPQIIRGLTLGNGWISNKNQYSYQSSGITEIAAIMNYLRRHGAATSFLCGPCRHRGSTPPARSSRSTRSCARHQPT